VVSYPLYDEGGRDGDLALVRLEHSLTFTNTIRPICLPLNTVDTFEKQVAN
jgi:hypothetical protein